MLTDTIHLVEDCRIALQRVRSSLMDLFESEGVNPAVPQEIAKRFGLHRNMAWKLSRIVNATDPFASLNHLPGPQGMELTLRGMEQSGVPAATTNAVRDAVETFQRMVVEHAGDREHLQLTLESMGLFESDAAAASGRELAFRGNSMVWGVQAKTRVALTILGPSANAGECDYALVSGLVGFRRLRPTARWRLYRAQMHDDHGRPLASGGHLETIDPDPPTELPFLLRGFCTAGMPAIVSFDGPDGREFCLPGGQVGNRGAFDCFFGYIFRGLPLTRGADNTHGSTAATITLPVESAVFDLLVHRDLPMPKGLEVSLHGFPHGGPEDPSAQTARNLLPLNEPLIALTGSPPAIATPLVPRLARMFEHVCGRMSWDATAFRGVRVVMRHPPMSSKLVMRWPLE